MLIFKKLIFSFKNALHGLWYVIEKEQNFRIELLAGLLVIIVMLFTGLQRFEMIAILLMVFAVLILEILNTSVERIVNMFKPRLHPYARIIKDITAAAVLLASIGSVIIGIIIFWPYFF
jgi:diacylglycerol kinase